MLCEGLSVPGLLSSREIVLRHAWREAATVQRQNCSRVALCPAVISVMPNHHQFYAHQRRQGAIDRLAFM